METANSSNNALVNSDLGVEVGKTYSGPLSSNKSNIGANTRTVRPSRCSSARSRVGVEVFNKQAVTKHSRPPKSLRYIPHARKALVWQRDQGQCCKCGSRRNLNFDHIKPLALGGESTASNLRLLCFHCNQRARMKTFGPRGAESPVTLPLST